ncbi:MAG: hypothetical protein HYZ10_14605 [Ignavibacteriales bacterium]|nr:hypothetical protein [Ignavibacteriales bacterium]
MKDIIIKNTLLKKEIIIWIVSLVIAMAINIYAILKYNASWTELLTQIPVMILISVLIYFVTLIARGITKTVGKILTLFKK